MDDHTCPPDTVRRLPMLGDVSSSMDRRGFLTQSVALAAMAVLAGACSSSPFGVNFNQPVTVKLADYPALSQVGGVARLNDTNVPIALANLGNDSYAALSLICPHQGGPISWRGDAFVCALHGATFADDGHWIGGQPTGHMHEYSTSYDATAGTVTVSP
jgi:Rieske Fe-S protein